MSVLRSWSQNRPASVASCVKAGQFGKNLEYKGSATSPANLQSLTAPNDHLSCIRGSPNASPLDILAVQAKPSVDVCNDTPSNLSSDPTDLDKLTDDDDTVDLFQKCNCNSALALVCFTPAHIQSSQRSMLVLAGT